MKTVDRKFQKEIEVERLWTMTNAGKQVFFIMLPFSVFVILGLWDKYSHNHLLIWFLLFNCLNFAKSKVLNFYHVNKPLIKNDPDRFKRIVFFFGVLTGFAWVACAVLFLDPSDPANVLIICLPAILQAIGSMVTWFAHLPTVLVIALMPSSAIMSILLSQGNLEYLVTAIFIAILPIFAYIYTKNLDQIVTHSLRLNFENIELRRESEDKSMLLETALENMGQGISMTDGDDCLRMWNEPFVQLLGRAGSWVTSNANLKYILNAADPPILTTDKTISEYYPSDDQVFEIRQTELRNGGRVLTYTDITNLIKREKALEKARKEAEQANAAKTRFLAVASHDLRQPIHALGLFFAELAERVHTKKNERIIRQVEDSIEAINSMLNALLDVSKLDAGIVKPEISPFSLGGLLSRLNAEFQPVAMENKNRLKIRNTTVSVISDPAMLERILRNLIGNALRYTKNGRILVGMRRRKKDLEIQVLDTGLGIPNDQLEDIFVEFHQLHNPARDRRQGLGLGLAIVKRLAHLLQHQVRVKSKPGHGSCFSIMLPMSGNLDQSIINSPNHSILAAKYAFTGYRMLILDDDISVRESMQGLLKHWGFDVITASTQQEAEVKLLDIGYRIDFMIVDYRLADNVSGIEVARHLLRQLNNPVGILIVTGDTGPERLREAEASGFPLLHKPVQPTRLRSTLQFLIKKPTKKGLS